MAHKSPGVIVALFCVLFLSGTALAEGSWASFLSQVLPGFESRSWTDKHVDHAATTVRFDGCRDAVPGTDPNDWAEVKLYREISFAPDEGFAIKRLYCWTSDTDGWGEMTKSGSYHWTLTNRSGPSELWNKFDASYVKTSY